MMFRLIIFILAILGCLWIKDNVTYIEENVVLLQQKITELMNEKDR